MHSINYIKNKNILITGASRGIGKSTAELLMEYQTNLILIARTADQLNALKTKLKLGKKNKVATYIADVSLEREVKRIKNEILKDFKRVDVIINNVGVGKYGNLASFSIQDYDWIMNSNMRSSFLITKYFSLDMLKRKSGHVVFVGSVAGLKGLHGEAIYCASKFAQTGFAQSLDHEFRKYQVKVSLIAPGGVNTSFAFGTGRKKGDPLLKKMLAAQDVAQSILFAINQSPKSRIFLVGQRPMGEPL